MEAQPLLGSSGIRARIARIPLCGKVINRVLDVPNPFFHPKNSPADIVLEQLIAETLQQHSKPLALNIGSRSKHKTHIINMDIAQNGDADVIADATYMPFADNSFDLIINIAVMEHTKLPHIIAAECYRILKPGGKLYCAIPFFQMYHPDPIDVQRYTVTGISNLFKDFRPLESGVELGPASAVSLTLREFLAILFSCNSNLLYNLFQVLFGYLLYPIKYLDYFLVRNKFAFMIACSVYFVGEKK
jgi:SAM-dependent methyltransferase